MIAELLRPFQLAAAERIATVKTILLADQPGLGKTWTALGALELVGALEPGKTSLVAAPGGILDSTWLPTIEAQLPNVNVIDAFSDSRARRNKRISEQLDSSRATIVLSTHDGIGISAAGKEHIPALHHIAWDAVIIDESHLVLPMEYDWPPQATNFWRGLFEILDRQREYALRLAMSGTPDRGKQWYRFGTWRFLMWKRLKPPLKLYESWLKENFRTFMIDVPVRGRSGHTFYKQMRKVGKMIDAARWERIDKTFVIRRTKKEVAPEMPEKQYIDVDLSYPNELLNAYQEHAQQFLINDDGTPAAATLYALRAAQFSICEWELGDDGKMHPVPGGHSRKRDWLIQWLTSRGYLPGETHDPDGGQVVIACTYVEVLRWLKQELAELGVDSVLISGDVPVKSRTSRQQEFQTGAVRVALLSSKMGIGIDLDAADDLILIDIPLDPDEQEQVEDRVHRLSRVHQVNIWRPRSRGTIDMAISARNDETFQKTRGMLDGSRGVQFARKILARIEA